MYLVALGDALPLPAPEATPRIQQITAPAGILTIVLPVPAPADEVIQQGLARIEGHVRSMAEKRAQENAVQGETDQAIVRPALPDGHEIVFLAPLSLGPRLLAIRDRHPEVRMIAMGTDDKPLMAMLYSSGVYDFLDVAGHDAQGVVDDLAIALMSPPNWARALELLGGRAGVSAWLQGNAQRVEKRLGEQAPIVVVFSTKGGVGKSTLSLGVAASFPDSVLFNFDLDATSVEQMSGADLLKIRSSGGLEKFYQSGGKPADALTKIAYPTKTPGVRVVPGPLNAFKVSDVPEEEFRRVLLTARDLQPSPRVIVVDGGIRVTAAMKAALSLCSMALFVVDQGPAITDAMTLLAQIPSEYHGKIHLVINGYTAKPEFATAEMIHQNMQRALKWAIPLLAVIPHDHERALACFYSGKSYALVNPEAFAPITAAVREVLGEEPPEPVPVAGKDADGGKAGKKRGRETAASPTAAAVPGLDTGAVFKDGASKDPKTAKKKAGKSKLPIIAAVLAVLVLAGGAGGYWWIQQHGQGILTTVTRQGAQRAARFVPGAGAGHSTTGSTSTTGRLAPKANGTGAGMTTTAPAARTTAKGASAGATG